MDDAREHVLSHGPAPGAARAAAHRRVRLRVGARHRGDVRPSGVPVLGDGRVRGAGRRRGGRLAVRTRRAEGGGALDDRSPAAGDRGDRRGGADRHRRSHPGRRRRGRSRSRTPSRTDEVVRLFEGADAGRHVRPAGEDVKEGQVLVEKRQAHRTARAGTARERRSPHAAGAPASARRGAVHGRRADPADGDARLRPGPRFERLHDLRRPPGGGRPAGARRHRRGRRRGASARRCSPSRSRRTRSSPRAA